ncbi:putative Endonuclease/exonuclease/phosphatase superfamily [Helianthus annuus]|nr:putative Endonuclease/exonuclease/phosphatase superfamily [Helianthus annuus]
MNFLSINVRGLGVAGKQGWVKVLRSKHGVDFVALQETKVSDIRRFDGSKCWGKGDYDCDSVEASGRSGGLINIWNTKVFTKNSVVTDTNFLLTSGFLVEDGSPLNVLNVYALQKVVAKRALWDKLKEVIGKFPGLWVILGDFNAVRCAEERKNSRFNYSSAWDFNNFIDDAGLHEYYMRGNKFTFIAGNNGDFRLSKIDRVFVCQRFFNRWPTACLRALPRELSDHTPLLLSLVDSNSGVKPFRWFNSWLDREGCQEVVAKALGECVFEGPPDVVIINKL